MSDPVVQWQIVTTSPDSVAAFCQKLFGWTITTNNALAYREVETGNGGTKGGIWPAPPEAHSFVQLFVSVGDVTRSVEQAVKLGGRVIVPPTTLPDGDTMAIIADPNGITFGLMQGQAASGR
ncbi:MAG TPA: VOC family protein [Thermoanaerobaculia bacterium]|nr:VOC family protein [Thermoanaerobaculia bacterium]